MTRSKLRIAQKLPLLIVCASLVLGLSLGVLGYIQGSNAVHEEVTKKLQIVLQARTTALSDYLSSIREDLSITASNPVVVSALKKYIEGWNAIEGNPESFLQNSYIEGNQYPTGEKEKLDFANDGTLYSAVHKRYHPWFRTALNTREYYDIFLFDLEGNLVYSVFKELDYATNLMQGKWSKSGLGDIFRAASSTFSPEHRAFVDFKPYAPSYDAPASFIGAPVFDNGEPIGVLAFQMSISRINGLMQDATGLGKSGESYIIGQDFLMRSDSRFSETSTILKREVLTETAKLALDGNTGTMETVDYRNVPVVSVYGPLEFMGVKWGILAEIDQSEFKEPINSMRNNMAIAGALLLLLVGGVGVLFARGVVQALERITNAMQTLARGNNEVEIPELTRQDEVGEMASALQIFKESAIKSVAFEKEQATSRKEAEAERVVAEEVRLRTAEDAENAKIQAEVEKSAALAELVASFENSVGSVVDSVAAAASDMESTAQTMTDISHQTSSQAVNVAKTSSSATDNVQAVASAAEELSASILEISNRVTQSSKVTNQAVAAANKADVLIQGLDAGAQKIGDVLLLIQDIAEQTNLLALNATIEAARAGDAGKGFAVVASEVKSLASQTAKATEQIGAQITDIQDSTTNAVSAIKEISSTISKVDEIAASIASAVEEQGAATQEISSNAQRAASGTQEVTTSIDTVTTAATKSGNASKEVLEASRKLSEQSDNLRQQVTNFVQKVS